VCNNNKKNNNNDNKNNNNKKTLIEFKPTREPMFNVKLVHNT